MKLLTGLNPYGISYHLGLHARGTPRANPNPVGLRGYIALATEFGAKSIEIWDGALISMSDGELIALRDELKQLGMRKRSCGAVFGTILAPSRSGPRTASLIRLECTLDIAEP